jgi:hypothetical protein
MRLRRIMTAALAILLVVGAVSALTVFRRPALAGTTGGIDPADFFNPVANPYFPLKVGTMLHYQGSEDGEGFREQVTITHWKKTIQGVATTVVLDVLRRADDGTVAEKTWDWYADDNVGNVWYFGERTATYTRAGRVSSREGSWQAGVHGAVAGTIMPANPHPTDAYRQEFLAGHAEDQAWIVQRSAHVSVPHRHLDHVVRSFEWTRLEANVLSLKFYARGLGIVLERDVAGGTEIFRLVSVTHA